MRTCLIVGALLALATSSLAAKQEPAQASLEDSIHQLRAEAKYREAVGLAETLRAERRADPEAKPYEIADCERLVATLELIAGLPDEQQGELAQADSLQEAALTAFGQGRYDEAAAFMERQLATRRRLLGESHPDVAQSMADLAFLLTAEGKYADAEPLYRDALAIRKALLGEEHPDVADNTSKLASLLSKRGDYEDAEPLFREALEMRRKLLGNEHPDVAESLNNLSLLLQAKGDYAGAEQLGREALAMTRKLRGDEHPYVAASLNNLAFILEKEGDLAGAEPLFREALAMRRKLLGNEHPDVAMNLNNLAALLEEEGDYAGAEPLFREALTISRKILGDKHPNVILGLGNLATLLQKRGDYAGAEPLFRKALALSRELLGNEHPFVATTLNNFGLLLEARGDYVGAEPLFREALAMRKKLLGDEHRDVAVTMLNLAGLLRARGDYGEAEPLGRDGLALLRKNLGDRHPDVIAGMNRLAGLLRDERKYSDAEELYREALALSREVLGDEHPDVVTGLSNLAFILEARGDYAGAEPLFREALAASRKSLGDQHPSTARLLSHIGYVLHEQRDDLRAERVLAEAADTYDAARLRAGSGTARATFQTSPYPRLAVARLALGRPDEAWPAAEKAQARALMDILVDAAERQLTTSEAAREDSLRTVLGNLQSALAVRLEAARGDTAADVNESLKTARDALLTTEAEWSAFRQEMATEHPITEGQAYALDHVQSVLSPGAAILGWLDVTGEGDECESWSYVIRHTGPVRWVRVPAGARSNAPGSPFERSRSYRAELADPASVTPGVLMESRRLWRERIEPILPALDGVSELVVVPSGAMLGVPIETLVDDRGIPLGETYSVSYAPSATIYTWLAERGPAGARGDMLLVGDPPFNPSQLAEMEREEPVQVASIDPMPGSETLRSALSGNDDALAALPRLRGARDEISSLARMSDRATALLGPEATEQELVRMAEAGELGHFGTLHVATHALVDDERPEQSALVLSQVGLPDPLEAALSGARVYDGLVTAEEILREWKLDADLVSLSACETGLGKEVTGEGYVGFAHAFLQAGARSVLVSLWKVDDTATSLLMRRFYEDRLGKYEGERGGHDSEPMPKADALREAKAWLRGYTDERGVHLYEHPYYWSAFVLIGDRS